MATTVSVVAFVVEVHRCSIDTVRDVGGGQGTRDRAGPVDDAGQSPETCVEVLTIVPVPLLVLVPVPEAVVAV